MLDELKPIFEQIDKNIFNEDTLKQVSAIIEAKVNEKTEARVTLAVEAATQTLDEEMTDKMTHLVKTIKENIDKDHLAKIQYVVEQLNTDHLAKMVTLKENYDKVLKETAQQHKMTLVESVDTFLEKYIDKNLPKQVIEEAAKNNHVKNLLQEARKVLGVDEKFVKNNVKEAFIDGKKQMDKLIQENAQLKQSKNKEEVQRFLVEKTANLPTELAKFLKKGFENKPLNLVKENFDYMVEMYEVREKKKKTTLLNESKPIVSNVDRSTISGDALITESSSKNNSSTAPLNPLEDMYLDVLARK